MWTERNGSSANWRKSSYSGSHGECVEVAGLGQERAIRDTTHRELGALLFDVHEWRTFIDSTKARP
ncbi:DUF397 domain-containing protein [Nocardiopsis sp. JB363]|uniref:DUF397 domain-containing protein n=1 Tax=Nocardiopsis sp. JB363 TaxID=1434837 RepID=UPI000B35215C|nr:DUF397 domain-containing protein [Nocardiopsis sp. JB363]